jgi:hypothetical protein
MARASALPLLPRYASPASGPAIAAAAADLDPLVRAAAPRALGPSAIDTTPEGLRIQVMDEMKVAIFPSGSALPNERVQRGRQGHAPGRFSWLQVATSASLVSAGRVCPKGWQPACGISRA